jgi:hypothetical protein
MELRRIIKLALISRINTSIKKSVVIKQNSILCIFLDIFVAIIRGPRELRERVGRAEAHVALMLTESTVNATMLPNAIVFLFQKN